MTRREAIISALKTKLSGLTTVPASQVYRSKVEAISRGKSPAVNVEPIGDAADTTIIPFCDWALSVRFSVFVRGAVPDQIADPMIEEIHSLVMSDLTLNGLCMDIKPLGVGFELLEGDQPIGMITLDYSVSYRTLVQNITVS